MGKSSSIPVISPPSCSFIHQHRSDDTRCNSRGEIVSTLTCPTVASSPHTSGRPRFHLQTADSCMKKRKSYNQCKVFNTFHTGKSQKTSNLFLKLCWWTWEGRLTGRRGVWVWRRESGRAAAAHGPIPAPQLRQACSCWPVLSLSRSRQRVTEHQHN